MNNTTHNSWHYESLYTKVSILFLHGRSAYITSFHTGQRWQSLAHSKVNFKHRGQRTKEWTKGNDKVIVLKYKTYFTKKWCWESIFTCWNRRKLYIKCWTWFVSNYKTIVGDIELKLGIVVSTTKYQSRK